MTRLRAAWAWFLAEWAVPIAIGLPLAGLVIWLGNAGVVLLYVLLGVAVGGLAGWASDGSLPRRVAVGAGVAVGLAALIGGTVGVFGDVELPPVLHHLARVVVTAPFLVALALFLRRVPRTPELRAAPAFVAAVVVVFGAVGPSLWLPHPANLIVPGVLIVLGALLARFRPEERPVPTVIIDADGVRRRLGQGEERVDWDQIVSVTLRTTSAGPYVEDVWWLLTAADGSGVAVPAGESGDLLGRLGRLPGFDHRAVIVAMGSTDDAFFPCWSGQPGQGVVCRDPVPPAPTG